MPIFANSEDLNTLNSAKRTVNAKLRRNYRNSDVSIDGGTSVKVADKYDAFVKLLIVYKAVLFELNTSFALTSSMFRQVVQMINDDFGVGSYSTETTPSAYPDLELRSIPSSSSSSLSPDFDLDELENRDDRVAKIADRFIGASSRLIQQTDEMSNFISSKLNNNFRQFSPQQMSEIADLIAQINADYTNLLAGIDDLEEGTDEEIGFNHIVSIWKKSAGLLIARLTALLASYTQGKSQSRLIEPDVGRPNRPIGAGYGSDEDDEPVFSVGKGMQMPTRYL